MEHTHNFKKLMTQDEEDMTYNKLTDNKFLYCLQTNDASVPDTVRFYFYDDSIM